VTVVPVTRAAASAPDGDRRGALAERKTAIRRTRLEPGRRWPAAVVRAAAASSHDGLESRPFRPDPRRARERGRDRGDRGAEQQAATSGPGRPPRRCPTGREGRAGIARAPPLGDAPLPDDAEFAPVGVVLHEVWWRRSGREPFGDETRTVFCAGPHRATRSSGVAAGSLRGRFADNTVPVRLGEAAFGRLSPRPAGRSAGGETGGQGCPDRRPAGTRCADGPKSSWAVTGRAKRPFDTSTVVPRAGAGNPVREANGDPARPVGDRDDRRQAEPPGLRCHTPLTVTTVPTAAPRASAIVSVGGGVGPGVAVGAGVGVGAGVEVGPGVSVGPAVAVGAGVGAAVGATVAVAVGAGVCVGAGEASAQSSAMAWAAGGLRTRRIPSREPGSRQGPCRCCLAGRPDH
jgi:hypothetical protein